MAQHRAVGNTIYSVQTSMVLHGDQTTFEIGSLCPSSLNPELASRGLVSMPVFQRCTSPLNVPPAMRAGWVGWNATHIKQLCVCVGKEEKGSEVGLVG